MPNAKPTKASATVTSDGRRLPRKLQGLTAKTQVLEDTKAERLLAASSSRRRSGATTTGAGISSSAAVAENARATSAANGAALSGEALPRESIAALYTLAARLHSPHLVYHAKRIETSAEKQVTTDQIWGQMSVLLRPVLRRLQDNVRHVEHVYGKATKATKATAKPADATAGSSSDIDEDAEPGTKRSRGADDDELENLSDLSEDDLDDAIASLLREQRKRKQAKAERRGGRKGDDDAWRYAFGKGGNGSDDEDDGAADEADDGDWGDGEDARGHDDDDVEGRMLDRNARAMRAADADEDEEAEDGDANAAEELAALKEMYGEDFEDDGEGMLGGEAEDPDLEKDLYYDDPQRDGDDGYDDPTAAVFAEGEDMLYNEDRDGARFWGKDDILREEEALASYGGGDEGEGEGDDGAAAAAEADPYDEELERALADPNLTQLERERLIERRHVEKLEQQRLFGMDWAMAGETAASRRPREALLNVDDLEFDYGMKAVPVITEGFTAKLEDRIKARILEKNYDDVQRRAAFTTANDLVTTRKDAALDSEKSKLSLMDLYEKEYMDKMKAAEEAAGAGAATAEPLTEIERDELRAINMWKRLSQHLDALSNFYYTPKPVQEDLEARVRAVDGAAPAITLENVGNFAATRENALAPQDLYRGSSRRFADVGSEELRPEERRALRRAKKEEGKKFAERKEQRTSQYKKNREVEKKAKAAAASA